MNKVKYGLTNVHIAPITETADGKEVYGEFQRLSGAVSLNMSPVGELTPFHADNMVYHTFSSNSGYEGTLEVAEIPEFFLTEILGEKLVNGVLVEDINAKGQSFAMAFEFDGDVKATRHVLYNCTATRPDINGATNTDSIEAQTSELSFNAVPNAAGVVRSKTGAETAEEVYDAWFTAPFDVTADIEG